MHASFKIAFDRASVRSRSMDGHLHVASSVVSTACVNDYLGSEIPHRDLLGLKADRMYALLRDPGALEKAVPSLHGKPLVLRHREQTAADHDRDITVGSVQNPVWQYPNVMAEITVWDGEAIRLIESGEQSDLSAGYFYRPMMDRGTFNGVCYDGIMCEIAFNHLCLVDVGRVTGAVVGDSAIRKGAMKMANPAMQKAYEALEKFLQAKLSAEDFQASNEYVVNLCRTCRMGDDDEETDAQRDEREQREEQGQDDPPDFRGKPRSTNSMVGDRRAPVTRGAQRSFTKLFPDAKPIAHV